MNTQKTVPLQGQETSLPFETIGTLITSDLGRLHSILSAQLQNDKATLAAEKNRLGLASSHTQASNTGGQASTRAVSVYSRVRSARLNMQNECQRWETARAAVSGGSVELYWLGKLLSLELETFWRMMELQELVERERIVAEVGQRFQSFIPRSLLQNLALAEPSQGQLALTLSHQQAKNLELIQEATRLEKASRAMETQLGNLSIAIANAESARELSHFESVVLAQNAFSLAEIQEAPRGAGGWSGFVFLNRMKNVQVEVALEAEKLEEASQQMRELIGRAIDLAESPSTQHEAQRLFAECREIVTVYTQDAPDLPTPTNC